jgi:hypothetical protein
MKLSLLKKPALDHARLNAAFADKDAKVKVLEEKRAVLDRFDEIAQSADTASRAAANSVRVASEYRQQWVRSGCPFAGHAECQRLDDEAAASKATAERAAIDGKAVDRERSQAQAAVTSAQSAVKEAEGKIDDEIGSLQVGEFDQTFDLQRGEQLAAEYQAWRIQARGLGNQLKGAHANRVLQKAVDQAQAQIKHIEDYSVTPQGSTVGAPPREVQAISAAWREKAAALRGDPNS